MPAQETMIHPETGSTLRRRRRSEVVNYMGLTRVVEVTGWFPEDGGDGVLVGQDSEPLDAALAEMKAEFTTLVKRLAKRVRKVAGLTQKDASLLLTGSPNSFYKYEHGEAQPSRPTLLLMKLLARQPKLIEEIKEPQADIETPDRNFWIGVTTTFSASENSNVISLRFSQEGSVHRSSDFSGQVREVCIQAVKASGAIASLATAISGGAILRFPETLKGTAREPTPYSSTGLLANTGA